MPAALRLSPKHRQELISITRRQTAPARTVRRAKVVLDLADGLPRTIIARRSGMTRQNIISLERRFRERRMDAVLADAPRPGRPATIPQVTIDAIIEATLHTKPRNATHWTARAMAAKFKVGLATVHRIWREHQLQPHRIESFKFSNDPNFAAKVRDVVGLYLNPPRKAVVLSVDEKSQIQALERTAPILPLRQGIPERQSHDYWRNGTTTLFAALNMLDGTVLGKCLPRHRNEEFIQFLEHIDRSIPHRLDIHVIVDNYGTHKHPNVVAWLDAHPRFHFHFTPTSGSWLNLVERFFAEITGRRTDAAHSRASET
jgi:transposase